MAFIVSVPGLGHYLIEGNPGDPASARLVVASPELVAEEERWRDLPIVLPSVPRVPDAPPCPVVLGAEGEPAKILGHSVAGPVGVAYRALRVLVGTYPTGITGKQLNEAASAANACSALMKLCRVEPRWRRVIVTPRLFRGRDASLYYRLAPSPSAG